MATNKTRKASGAKARPLQLKKVFELKTLEGATTRIFLDGELIDGSTLRTTSAIGYPFDLIKLDDNYVFDCEVWVNNALKFIMPSKTPWSERVVNLIEAGENPVSDAVLPEPEDSWKKTLGAVRAELAHHQGLINHLAWERLARMLALHALNYQDLKEYLSEVLTEETFLDEVISQSADPAKREAHLVRIDQKIHNFAASGTALENQAKTLMAPYKGTEFWRRFLESQSSLTSSGAVQFLRDLRSFLAHQGLPFTEQSWSFTTEPRLHRFEIGLSSSELLRNTQWGKVASRYIESSKGRVNILSTIIDAFSLENKHWHWTIRQADQLNKIHRALASEIEVEANWILTLGRQGRPRLAWAQNPDAL